VLAVVTTAVEFVVQDNVADVAVAAADITIELAAFDTIVVPAGIPVPVIGIPAYKYVVEGIPETVVLPIVVTPEMTVVSILPLVGDRLS
jgi:hypothetical protein